MKFQIVLFFFLIFSFLGNAQLKIGFVKKACYDEIPNTYITGFGNAGYTNKNNPKEIVFYFYSRMFNENNKSIFYGIVNITGNDILFERIESGKELYFSKDKKSKLEVKYSGNYKTGVLIITNNDSKIISKKVFFHNFSG